MTNVRILAQILEYNVKILIMWFVDGTAKKWNIKPLLALIHV